MAHPRVVAVRRQIADLRLREAAKAAAKVFSVTLKQGPTLPNRHPDLAAAELVENVAEFIETITAAQGKSGAAQQRKAG